LSADIVAENANADLLAACEAAEAVLARLGGLLASAAFSREREVLVQLRNAIANAKAGKE
jgi:hypothetical protein